MIGICVILYHVLVTQFQLIPQKAALMGMCILIIVIIIVIVIIIIIIIIVIVIVIVIIIIIIIIIVIIILDTNSSSDGWLVASQLVMYFPCTSILNFWNSAVSVWGWWWTSCLESWISGWESTFYNILFDMFGASWICLIVGIWWKPWKQSGTMMTWTYPSSSFL